MHCSHTGLGPPQQCGTHDWPFASLRWGTGKLMLCHTTGKTLWWLAKKAKFRASLQESVEGWGVVQVSWMQFCSWMELGRSWGPAWLLHPLPRNFSGVASSVQGQCPELDFLLLQNSRSAKSRSTPMLNGVKKENSHN